MEPSLSAPSLIIYLLVRATSEGIDMELTKYLSKKGPYTCSHKLQEKPVVNNFDAKNSGLLY